MAQHNNGTKAPYGSQASPHDPYHTPRSQPYKDQNREIERRRDYLWRKQLELELEVRSLLAQQQALQHQWNMLQTRKAAIQRGRPVVAFSLLVTRQTGMLERNYHYAMQRISQDEHWLMQQGHMLEARKIGVESQLEAVVFEVSLLDHC